MQFETMSVKATEKDEERSLTGKFPMLELHDGTTLSEPISICRFFANNKLGFYGPDATQRAKVDEWIDIISLTVVPMSVSLVKQARGQIESDVRSFSQQLGEFRN